MHRCHHGLSLSLVAVLLLTALGSRASAAQPSPITPPEVRTLAATDVALASLLASGTTVTAIRAGWGHTCALTGEGEVFCWGINYSGQLGDGTTTERRSPVRVKGLSADVVAIDAGFSYTCAVTAVGSAFCWGANSTGTLGDGTHIDRSYPVPVTGLSEVVDIFTGSTHSCALTSQGGVFCWGWNWAGELGDGSTIDRVTPVAVIGLDTGVRAVRVGSDHTCALTTMGAMLCWGHNCRGQLGDGSTVGQATPLPVPGLSSGVTDIAASGLYSCALLSTGEVQCWGSNEYGQLGDGTTTDRFVPTPTTSLALRVTNIVTGGFHTCALTDARGVLCWGANYSGQLGDSTTTDRDSPTQVTGLVRDVRAISTGYASSFALTYTGDVIGWGGNYFGNLGDGTTTDRHTPVHVYLDWPVLWQLHLPLLSRPRTSNQ